MFNKIRTWFNKHKARNGFILVLVIIGFLIAQRRIKAFVAGPEAQYETSHLSRRDLKRVIDASGQVMAHEEAVIQFQASGKLAWVGVQKGQLVKKWQAIASLNRESLQQNLKKELLDYQKERWDFEQDQDNYKTSGLPLEKSIITDEVKRILEKAQFDLDSAVIDYELAKLSFDLAVIYTPIEGIVTGIDSPVPGINITPATARFTVTNPNSMYFEVKVDEADIGQIKEGVEVRIALDAYPEEVFTGEIEKIHFAAVTTRGGGTAFPVEISLPPNEGLKFKSGMNGDAEIILEQKENVLSLPYRTIKGGENPFVEIIENREVIKKEVQTGLETDSWIEITGGLTEQDLVIVSEKKKT